MNHRLFIGATLLAASAATAHAQSATASIAAGDKALAAKDAPGALAQYQAAAKAAPENINALWRAAHAAVIVGEFAGEKRDSLYQLAQNYGEKAVEADSNNAFARFALAEALGRIALTIESPIGKLPYSRGTYANATACLKLNPKSAECAHIMGVWNSEVMKIDAGQRSMAVSFMGATEIGEASLAKAAQYLQRAVKAEPKRTVHHLDLARVYAQMEQKAKAKAEFQAAIAAPAMDYNDKNYKAQAQTELKALGA